MTKRTTNEPATIHTHLGIDAPYALVELRVQLCGNW